MDIDKIQKSVGKVCEVRALTPEEFDEWQNVLNNEREHEEELQSVPTAARESSDKPDLEYYLDDELFHCILAWREPFKTLLMKQDRSWLTTQWLV